MRRVVVFFFFVFLGCSTGTSPREQEDAGLEGGMDAMTTVDASHGDAEIDAGCARLSKPEFPCADDSDCPAPQPPQNLQSYCCGVISTTAGVCEFPSLSSTTCQHGGCADAPLQCNATSGTVGERHMCTRGSDCSTQLCCTVCRSGLAISMCLSSAEATMYGAQCM